MRIIFCDDNPISLVQLRQYVAEFFHMIGGAMPEFAAYPSGDALLKAETQADIAFLDVEMPGVSGIHVGAKLKEKNPHIKILIVTSYPDYLDEAMRFQVFRYLSKPIDKQRLFRNLKDALYQYNMEVTEYPIATREKIVICRSDEIICVEAADRSVLVYTQGGILKSTKNMDYWREQLSLPCFYIPHRSYIINMAFVMKITKDTIFLKCTGFTKEVYLARRRYVPFKDAYLLYLESVK